MASRISQMRNGQLPPQQQPPMSTQQLNESIEQTRMLMQAIQSAQNPSAALAQMLQNNPNTPMIANLLRGNGSLEAVARQIAQMKGYNIADVINGLQGGM